MNALRTAVSSSLELASTFTATQLMLMSSAAVVFASYIHGIWLVLMCCGSFMTCTALLRNAQHLLSVSHQLLKFQLPPKDLDYSEVKAEISGIKKKMRDKYIHSWARLVDINMKTVEVLDAIMDKGIDEIVLLVQQGLINPEAVLGDLIESAQHHLQQHPDYQSVSTSSSANWQQQTYSALDPMLKNLSEHITHILRCLIAYRVTSTTERALRDILYKNVILALINYLCQQQNILKIVILIFADDSDTVLANCTIPQDPTTSPSDLEIITENTETASFELEASLEQSFHDVETNSGDGGSMTKSANSDSCPDMVYHNVEERCIEQKLPNEQLPDSIIDIKESACKNSRSYSFEIIGNDEVYSDCMEEYISENLTQFFKVKDTYKTNDEQCSAKSHAISTENEDQNTADAESDARMESASESAATFFVSTDKLVSALRDSRQSSLDKTTPYEENEIRQEITTYPTSALPITRLTSAFKRPELASAMSLQAIETPLIPQQPIVRSPIPQQPTFQSPIAAANLTSAFKVSEKRKQSSVSSDDELSTEQNPTLLVLAAAGQSMEDDKSTMKDSTSNDSGHGNERRFHSVSIPSTQTHYERGSGLEYTLYCIIYQATYHDEGNQEPKLHSGRVLRRYREFCNLVARLEKSSKYSHYVKRMQGPSWLQQLSLGKRNKRQQEVEKRRKQLHTFLNQLIDCEVINSCSDLAEFLAYNSGDGQIEFVRERVRIIPKRARIDELLVKTVSGMLGKVTDRITVNTGSPDKPNTQSIQTGQDLDRYLVALADETHGGEQLLSLYYELDIDQPIRISERDGVTMREPDEIEIEEGHLMRLSALADKLVDLVLLLLQPHASLAKNPQVIETFRPTITLLVSSWLRDKIGYLTEPNKVVSLLQKAQNAIWPTEPTTEGTFDLQKLKTSAKDSILGSVPWLASHFVNNYISTVLNDLIGHTVDDQLNKILIVRTMERFLTNSAKVIFKH